MKSYENYLATHKLFNNVLIIISRVLVAKPHSADVESLISTSIIFKSSDRQSLWFFMVDTENKYLFAHFKMPPLTIWDPKRSTLLRINLSDRRFKEIPKAREQDWFKDIFKD